MRRVVFCAAAALVALVSLPSAQQADKVKAASDYLGAGNMKSVRFTGFGANYTVGQPWSPGDAWPKVNVKSYDAQINYETTAMQVDVVREMGPTPPRGGGVAFTGEQRQQQFVVGTVAWDNPAPAAAGGGRGRGGAPAAGGRAGGAAPEPGRVTLQDAMTFAGIQPPAPPITPQPAAGVDRMLQVYLTAHGFLRGAAANNATTRAVAGGTEVTYTVQGKYKLTGLLNARNEVEKVSTVTSNPVLGDMPIEVTYSNYQKTDADTMFPLRIVQRTGGHVSLELWVSSVLTNPAPATTIDPRNAPSSVESVNLAIPAAARNATIPVPTVNAEKIGDGIFYMTGGTHHSVAIEMRDHIILVEAPQNEARSTAVIAKVKETIPNKPIKYVVNTHVHFDHSGGLRTLVNEGATVVTQQANRAFYQKAWAQPHTITPDLLSQSKKAPTFLTFLDKQVLTDGRRTVEVYRIQNSNHNDSFAMVYVPAAKLLIEADAYTAAAAPPAGQAPRGGGAPAAGGPAAGGGRAGAPAAAPPAPAGPNPETVNLYANVQRLKLDVAQIAGLHGRLATIDELKTAATPVAPAATAGQ